MLRAATLWQFSKRESALALRRIQGRVAGFINQFMDVMAPKKKKKKQKKKKKKINKKKKMKKKK